MGQTSTPETKLAPGANKRQFRWVLNVLVLGQQAFHLIEHNRRILVLFDPVKRSKVSEKGLIDQDDFNIHEQKDVHSRKSEEGKVKHRFKGNKGVIAGNLDLLKGTGSAQEFRLAAKKLIEDHGVQVLPEIIQQAHELREKTDNKKIVWFVYSVRDALQKYPPERHSELLKRMFRRSNPQFVLPD